MHYYTLHIKDTLAKTAHLSYKEDLIYRRILDWCHLHERPLPLLPVDIYKNLRMRRSDWPQIERILQDFFTQTEQGWECEMIALAIEKYHGKAAAAREKARIRWEMEESKKDAAALLQQCHGNANHKPITNNHKPNTKHTASRLVCPHEKILELWKKFLPNLQQPRSWTGQRLVKLRERWSQASKPSPYSEHGYDSTEAGLRWWASFFEHIATSTRLADGWMYEGKQWKPDLEFVLREVQFQKIIDGSYDIT